MDINDVPLSTPTGMVIPARTVIAVRAESGPEQIERKNQERIVRVNAEIETTLSEAVSAVNGRIPEMEAPTGRWRSASARAPSCRRRSPA